MFEVKDLVEDKTVAEAEDLASARTAVETLLDEGYSVLSIFASDGTWLENGRVLTTGEIGWTSTDLIRKYDGRSQ